jgi:serine/threonine-protein kinase
VSIVISALIPGDLAMSVRSLSALLLLSLVAAVPCHAEDDYYRQRDEYYKRLEEQQRQYDRDRVNYAWLYEDDDCFAAIAYSPKTGKYGYSYDYSSRGSADQAALRRCTEPDARIVSWCKNAYCALAEGDDGYGTGWGATAAQARANALRECEKNTTNAKIVVCVFSGS